MRKLGALCAAAVMGLPLAAMAEGLSYNYLEGGYVVNEPDDADFDYDGYRVKGSLLINEGIYILAGYTDLESDENANGASATSETITAGLGARFGLGDATDLNIEAAWLNTEVGVDGGIFDGADTEDDGFTAGVGVRHLFLRQLEAGLKVDYVDIFEDDDFNYTASVLFHAIPMLSIGGSYTIADNSDTWTAGLRFNF